MTDQTLFSRIIARELPGRFVWQDEEVVAFLTIAPHQTGHTLVVPREPIDKWTDLPPALWLRLNEVAMTIGQAMEQAFDCVRVGTVIAGLEVPHCHIHLIPMQSEADLGFGAADHRASAESLDAAADRLRATLGTDEHGDPRT